MVDQFQSEDGRAKHLWPADDQIEDSLVFSAGLTTRSRAKDHKEALRDLVLFGQAKEKGTWCGLR